MSRQLCHCLLVDEKDVVAAIRAGARTVDEVGDRCEAGTGCGSCRGGIAVLLREEEARRRARGDSDDAQRFAQQLGLFDRVSKP